MITVRNLSKTFGTFAALSGLSFSVARGEVVGLLGPNGAGKTTTMRILTGYLSATGGEVTIDGVPVVDDPEGVQKKIGYLPEQAPLYPDLTAYEHLEFAAEAHGLTGDVKAAAIRTVAADVGLADRLYFTIAELSKGYRQRVGLAQALIHDPQILILDEPTTGLDPNQIVEIRDLIKKLGKEKTIILSTHIMQEVEAVCDRVILVANGRLAAEGATAELTTREGAANHIRVVVQASANETIDLLKTIPGVQKVTRVPGAARGTATLLVAADDDLRAAITKKLVKADIDILELGIERQTMEDVFKELTK